MLTFNKEFKGYSVKSGWTRINFCLASALRRAIQFGLVQFDLLHFTLDFFIICPLS